MASGRGRSCSPNRLAVSPVRGRENGEQDRGDRGGSNSADRTRKLHHGGAGAEHPRPATAWTVTWTTPITVPMKQVVTPNTHGSADQTKTRHRQGKKQQTYRLRPDIHRRGMAVSPFA